MAEVEGDQGFYVKVKLPVKGQIQAKLGSEVHLCLGRKMRIYDGANRVAWHYAKQEEI
jgi:hypothetical protein